MDDAVILRHDAEGIATLTLNRPKNLNPLCDATLAALTDQIEALKTDTTTRVVILRGAGKVFCAGHDLREMQAGRAAEDRGKAYFKDLFDRCSAVMLGLQSIPQPVIAQVHGIATAAGCQLVASCDLAIAAEDTRFGVNGVNIGLFCSTPMVALTRVIGRKAAFEMLTTGGFISTDQAADLGLINRAVPHDDLDAATLTLAQTIADKLGTAVKIGKRAFYDQIDLPVAEAYAHTGQVMVENLLHRDTDEGINAFLDKRPPDWAPK
jgi:enoyl-CoA hydratase/carnithine racemase